MSKAKITSFPKGSTVEAKLVELGHRQAIFDIGGKSEGVVRDNAFLEVKDFLRKMKIGDNVQALVLDPENRDGYVVISVRHAAKDKLWNKLAKAYESGDPISVTGKSVNEKGVMVSVDTVSAFIPTNYLGKKAAAKPQELIDKSFKVKVLDLDKNKNRIILSEKAVSEAHDIDLLNNALESLEVGKVYSGKVTTMVSFGVFVELTVKVKGETKPVSVEGLVHVSEMSWAKVNDPAEVTSEGETVSVKVMGVEKDKTGGNVKVSLSMRQAQEDPWDSAADNFKKDDKVTGKVVRTSDFGVFVELKNGIEGLIHVTKIPPGTSFAKGDTVSCYIEDIDAANHKISLGLIVTTSKPVGYK